MNTKPMLAMPIEIDTLFNHKPFTPTPKFLAQPKIYGVRALWHPEKCQLLTKNGREITSMGHIVYDLNRSNKRSLRLEGELYSDEIPFEELNGLIRQKGYKFKEHHLRKIEQGKIESVSFYVFDFIDYKLKMGKRAKILKRLEETENILAVQSFLVKDELDAQYWYQTFLEKGFEGIIFRNINMKYEPGESKALYKLKPIKKLEAKIIQFIRAEKGIYKDTFKSLLLKLPNGVQFKCSGISDIDRVRLWNKYPVGTKCTINYERWTNQGKPTCARFKCIGEDI